MGATLRLFALLILAVLLAVVAPSGPAGAGVAVETAHCAGCDEGGHDHASAAAHEEAGGPCHHMSVSISAAMPQPAVEAPQPLARSGRRPPLAATSARAVSPALDLPPPRG